MKPALHLHKSSLDNLLLPTQTKCCSAYKQPVLKERTIFFHFDEQELQRFLTLTPSNTFEMNWNAYCKLCWPYQAVSELN